MDATGSISLPVPSPIDLLRGARWQVENMPLPIALRAMTNVVGDDFGKEIHDGWSTDFAYVLAAAACGDVFRFGLHVHATGSVHEAFRVWPPEEHGDVARLGLDALGRTGPVCIKGTPSWPTDDAIRDAVVATLRAGRPVIAVGLPRPEHVALVTGFEAGGDALVGWSCQGGGPPILFGPELRERFNSWHGIADVIVLCGEKATAVDRPAIYRAAIGRGIALLRREQDGEFLAGQPLYAAWAAAFIKADSEESIRRAGATIDPYVWDLAERRHYARVFLATVCDDLRGADDLNDAASEFGAIHDLMWDLFRTAGGQWPGDPTPGVEDAATRRKIAEIILQAAACDARAAEGLEAGLAT